MPWKQLEATRRTVGERLQNPLKDISFDTISGAGDHAAIMHYRVTTESDRTIEPGTLFLIDSGAQYINGTTDITARSRSLRRRGEKALLHARAQGMIAISTARFPKGSRGEISIRWHASRSGRPAPISRTAPATASAPIFRYMMDRNAFPAQPAGAVPGMILSNEPGYYRPGAFGIRIENLIVVNEGRHDRGRRPADARFRDDHLVPDRPAVWW